MVARGPVHGANPARRTEASSRRPYSAIRTVLGTVTVHTAYGRVRALPRGELGVDAAGLGGFRD